MIAESDCEVSDDNISDIDDDDELMTILAVLMLILKLKIMFPTLSGRIKQRRYTLYTLVKQHCGREGEKTWENRGRRGGQVGRGRGRGKGRDRSTGNVQGRGTSQLHHQVNPPQAPGDVRKKRQSSKNTANDRKRCQSLELGMGYTTNLALSHKSTPVI